MIEKLNKKPPFKPSDRSPAVDAIVARIEKDYDSYSIYDFPIGRKVVDYWFMRMETFEVIGHDEETNQVQVKHVSTGGFGSYYVKPFRLLAAYCCRKRPELFHDVRTALYEKGYHV